MHNRSWTGVVAGGVLGLLLVAGCSSPTEQSAGAAPATTDPSSSPSSSPASTPLCGTPDLRASVREAPGGGAAGSVTSELWLTNAGDHPCTLSGWAGVSYVGDRDGTQVGAAATRTSAADRRTVILIPGAHAVEEVTERDPGAFGDRCRPADVDGLRVYPPDNRESLFVRHPGTACASPAVELLSVVPVHDAS